MLDTVFGRGKEWQKQEQIRCGPCPHAVHIAWGGVGVSGGGAPDSRAPLCSHLPSGTYQLCDLGQLPNVLYSGELWDQIPVLEERPPSNSRTAFPGRNWTNGDQLVSPGVWSELDGSGRKVRGAFGSNDEKTC